MQRLPGLALISSVIVFLLCVTQTGIVHGQRAERRVRGRIVSGQGPAKKRVVTGSLPAPKFSDPDRARKLAAAFPEIEKLFDKWVTERHVPGEVFGIIIDGELVWLKTKGVRETKYRSPVTPDTTFRIASMTKSFTALSILKLRDEGKLSLDDPVARYVPALANLPYPTKDSAVLTIRHLLTHSEGFPEDNPWGDRQLAQSDETIRAWMRAGIPFSNAPGTAYEYSNYGFAILGQVGLELRGNHMLSMCATKFSGRSV